MHLGISEILKKADEAPTKEDKIRVLHENHSLVLKMILAYAFDPDIKFLLPPGPVDYRPNDLPDNQNILYIEARRLYLFIEGGHPTLKQDKREALFAMFLESLDAADAELMVAVKDKTLPYKSIDWALVQAAYPDFKKN